LPHALDHDLAGAESPATGWPRVERGLEEINWGTLAAAATLITLPVLMVALIAQRHIVTGLTFGAVKQ
jgi:ABC-type glycerol-3-phosphate transport system permease component